MAPRRLLLVSAAAALLVLAACSQPAPTPSGPQQVHLTGNPEPGGSPMLAGFFVMADASAIGSLASSVIEATPGMYYGPASPIDSEGSLDLILPDPQDVPSATTALATGFVHHPSDGTVCATTASDPAVRVSQAFSMLIVSFPGVFLVGPGGAGFTFITDAPYDFSGDLEQLADMKAISWLYASGATDAKTAAPGCAGPNPADPVIHVDLHLKKGWNQVAWTAEVSGGILQSLTLSDAADVDPVYVNSFGGSVIMSLE